MKAYKIFISIAIILVISNSCQKEFLDEYPLDEISKSNFYATATDAEGGLISVYDALQNGSYFGCYLQETTDQFSDDVKASGNDVLLDEFSYQVTEGRISGLWSSLYTAIGRAHAVMDGVSGMSEDVFESNRKQEILAETRFVRAMSYFYLVRLWGEVPLVTSQPTNVTPEEVYLERSSVTEIYNFIISELEECADILPDEFSTNDDTRARATKGGARTVLAQVHATLGDWSAAANYADLVIQSSVYNLVADYGMLFDPAYENTEEAIFEIQFMGPDEGSQMAWLTLPVEVDGQAWTKYFLPSDDLVQAFESENDSVRKVNTIYMSVDGPHRWKTRDYGTGSGSGPQNIIAYRLAEMYLLKAEALNELGYVADGEAFDALNAIRTRAGLTSYSSADLADAGSFRLATWKERRLELALEGQRWFDLLRTGTAKTTMEALGYTLPEYKLLCPIPQSERDKNPNLTQNTGWF